jgi:3-methyl-2-oxobutanoate hydroxymethyltransferase
MSKVTSSTLLKYKQEGRKFTALTAYDASFASAFDGEGIDVLLVGDSLGMVLQGHDDTLPVTTAEIAYHTRCVRRGIERSLLIADMPFMSYATPEQAMENATALMQAGANMVKLEGGAWLSETVTALTRNGIPVCVHLGLTPQSVHVFGGYKVQARTREAADQLIADCRAVVDAGAAALLLECVPAQVGREISELFPDTPVIGIGAGAETDGQVLVVQDMLGLNFGHVAKFVRNFMQEQAGAAAIADAFKAYHAAVQDGSFPAKEHTFQIEL